ncbi:MAG: hypothetical protein Q8935_05000 [Bacillota bacterium]|nr:hypothetical protein [Bacillota bacterium]MDP4155534.1 hypothetical protein [Bacillota bacterium]
MSLADFDDIYMICNEWEMQSVFEDLILSHLNGLSSDLLTYQLTSRSNRWEEFAEKEINNIKRDEVLV